MTLIFSSFKKEIACERECSRGEDYRLIKLTIIDYNVRIIVCCFFQFYQENSYLYTTKSDFFSLLDNDL